MYKVLYYLFFYIIVKVNYEINKILRFSSVCFIQMINPDVQMNFEYQGFCYIVLVTIPDNNPGLANPVFEVQNVLVTSFLLHKKHLLPTLVDQNKLLHRYGFVR